MKFSTKRQDAESGLYYYGYRYYNPATSKWLNRDPMFEVKKRMPEFFGDKNLGLYHMVANNSIDYIDFLGLSCLVRFKCKLNPQSPSRGVGFINCKYTCTEVSRVDITGMFDRVSGVKCSDLPKPMTIPANSTQFCSCDKTMNTEREFTPRAPKLDCSSSNCRAGCDIAHNAASSSKDPRIRAAAEAAKAACYDICNSICSK